MNYSTNRMNRIIMNFFIYCNIVILFAELSSELQCLDEQSNPVDWFVAYKLPAVQHEDKLVKNGLFYMYMTSRNPSEWISSDIPINSSNSLIAQVIFSLYHNQELDLFILYNNESPNGKSNSNKGHTKGVVLVNNEGGFWLIHSVPKFPLPEKYQFPESGLKYGQSFLCISMNLENIDKVGLQLQYNEPNIYSMNIPSQFHTTTPNLVAAAKNVVVSKSPWYHQAEITSLMGTDFISFAKSNKFGKDIYEDWVAPVLQYNLSVETWPNGPGRLNSDCSKPFKVKNIQSIYLSKLNLVFNSTHDHSKWAIAIAKEKAYWICIGDINRAEHQEKRGGGTVCLCDENLSNQYKKLIRNVEECK